MHIFVHERHVIGLNVVRLMAIGACGVQKIIIGAYDAEHLIKDTAALVYLPCHSLSCNNVT